MRDLGSFYSLVKEKVGSKPPNRASPWKPGIYSRGFPIRSRSRGLPSWGIMPITEKGLKKIKLVNREDKEVDVLLLRWPPRGVSQHLVALLCRVGVDGIILALPKAGMDEETLMAGQRAPPEDMVGPNTVVEVTMLGSEGPASEELLLVEFNKTVLPPSREEACENQESHHRFCQWEGPDARPCGVRGRDRGVARTWRSPTSPDYVTAVEGLPPPPGNPGEAFNMEKLDEVLVGLGTVAISSRSDSKAPHDRGSKTKGQTKCFENHSSPATGRRRRCRCRGDF